MTAASSPSARTTLAVFSFTLFLSAACMFALQPMAGKMLLPLVGGTPAGWVVAMAFFQIMLLAGYFLAHLLSLFSPRTHALLYIAALAVGAVFLPLNISAHANLVGESPGAADVLKILTVTLAIPFIALSATSSTIQRLFMTTGHTAAKDPYFLYAASNLGSFAGLLSYPILIEPHLPLTAQAHGWQGAYLLLAAGAVLCLLLVGKKSGKTAAVKKSAPLTWPQRAEWFALAFFPSSLLLGVTTYITTDVISVPMIWVIPLAVYLLAFVAAFARKPPVSVKTAEACVPLAVIAVILALVFKQFSSGLAPSMAVLHLLCFGGLALYCALRLAASRPAAGKLTEFYLLLALGGALGGSFNAFVAPHVFIRVVEYPLALLALPLLLPGNGVKTFSGRLLLVTLAAGLLLANAMPAVLPVTAIQGGLSLCVILAALVLLAPGARAGFLFPVLTCVFLLITFTAPGRSTVAMKRNFFGALKVYEAPAPGNTGETARYFMHGTTLHGFQIGKRNVMTSYYSAKGHFGDVFKAYSPRRVGVIGLGAGTINCFTAPGRSFTFFDIDPDVVDIAQNQFTFLSACKPPRIIVGDGRLELAKLNDEKFDLLVIDAFSSDSIPVHLLTTEAMRLYFDRLGDKGVLAVHISNHHFRLHTPIAVTTDALGLQSKYATSMDIKKLEPYATKSVWLVVARKNVDLDAFAKKYGWIDIPRDPSLKPWTDDYTNLLSAMHIE